MQVKHLRWSLRFFIFLKRLNEFSKLNKIFEAIILWLLKNISTSILTLCLPCRTIFRICYYSFFIRSFFSSEFYSCKQTKHSANFCWGIIHAINHIKSFYYIQNAGQLFETYTKWRTSDARREVSVCQPMIAFAATLIVSNMIYVAKTLPLLNIYSSRSFHQINDFETDHSHMSGLLTTRNICNVKTCEQQHNNNEILQAME